MPDLSPYLSQLVVFAIALLGIMVKSVETDDKGSPIHSKFGANKLTTHGKIIAALLFVSLLFSFYMTWRGSKEGKEKEAKLSAELAKVQEQNENLSQSLNTQGKQNLSEFEKQRSNLLSVLDTQRQTATETTNKIENSANTLLDNLRSTSDILGKRLNTSIHEVEGTVNNLSLDRNVWGFEISYKPSTTHWSEILRAYKKIKSPVTLTENFPFSAAVMIADKREGYWNIDFTPIVGLEGTARFPPTSTNQPNGKLFEEVIQKALINLFMKWGNYMELEISPRGSYRSSIRISQDMIVYTFHPPEIRLILRDLKDDSTIEFRAADYPVRDSDEPKETGYPEHITLRSLDSKALFNQTISLSWKKDNDPSHIGRVMPYTSGPHRLNVTFK